MVGTRIFRKVSPFTCGYLTLSIVTADQQLQSFLPCSSVSSLVSSPCFPPTTPLPTPLFWLTLLPGHSLLCFSRFWNSFGHCYKTRPRSRAGSMPFPDREPAPSGRDSRASDLSSHGVPRKNGQAPGDMFSSGVMSMLRNTTDTGDIGAFSIKTNRLPSTMPRPAHRRRTNTSHTLDTSSQHRYAPSQMSNRSSHNQPWDTSSLGRRGSVSSLSLIHI